MKRMFLFSLGASMITLAAVSVIYAKEKEPLSVGKDTPVYETISAPDVAVQTDTVRTAPIVRDTIPSLTIPEETIPQSTIPGQTIPHDTIPQDTIPGQTIPHDTIPGETIPTNTIPQSTISANTIPTATIPSSATIEQVSVSQQAIQDYLKRAIRKINNPFHTNTQSKPS